MWQEPGLKKGLGTEFCLPDKRWGNRNLVLCREESEVWSSEVDWPDSPSWRQSLGQVGFIGFY